MNQNTNNIIKKEQIMKNHKSDFTLIERVSR